ncbi:unnamed protein product, partial [Arabidopsis halleri]
GDSGLSESEVIGEDKFKIRQRKGRRRKRRESFQLKRKSKKKVMMKEVTSRKLSDNGE